jgi:O-methyltransferase
LDIADVSYRPNFVALAHAVKNAPIHKGAVIECGVFRGSTLLGIAHRLEVLGIRDAKLIGCDSFQGFPAPVQEDALEDGTFHERAQEGVFRETSYEALQSRIEALGYAQNIRLLKGFFAETLLQLSGVTFSLVHLDCDLYESYLSCLYFLYPRLVPGGFMVFDEYDTSASVYPGAKKAIDEFLLDKPEKLQRLGDQSDARWFIVKI